MPTPPLLVFRTTQMLDDAESFSEAHTNRFSGRRSHLADFVKGAKLADPRRTSGSGKSIGSASLVSATAIPSIAGNSSGRR